MPSRHRVGSVPLAAQAADHHGIALTTEKSDSPATGMFTAATRPATLLDHPTFAVAAVRNGRVRRANACWNALFAVRTDVSVEPHIVSLFSSAHTADRFERALQTEFRNGIARIEHMLLRRDGVSFMAEIVVHRLVGENPFDADAIWQVRDISAERELRREIREIEEYYRALSTYQGDITFVLDRELNVSFASPSVDTVLGHRAHGILGESFTAFLAPEEVAGARAWLAESLETKGSHPGARPRESFRLRFRHRDGNYRVLSCRQRNCLDIARIAGIVINARDVTDEVEEERARDAAHARAVRLRETLFALATAPALEFDARVGEVLRVATQALEVSSVSFWQLDAGSGEFFCRHANVATGLAAGAPRVTDPKVRTFSETDSPLHARQIQRNSPIVIDDVHTHPAITAPHLARLEAAGVGALLDFPVARDALIVGVLSVNQEGGPRSWQCDEIDFAGGISLLVALAIERRDREAALVRNEFIGLHDGLTGLVNRTHAERELMRFVEAAKASGNRIAVLMIDLDLFKEFNDVYGHAAGDALLVAVAARLIEAAGPNAMVARMGGDEFLVALPDAGRVAMEPFLRNVLDRLGGQGVAGVEKQIRASIGVAMFPNDGGHAETLLTNAEIAMYEAKSRGRNQAFTFNAKLAEGARLQREFESEISEALEKNEFCLWYQPQLDLDKKTVVGLEALLRWQHPRRGLLLPDAFMAAAQQRGMIDTITKWTLTEVCEQIVAWQRSGSLPDVPISVNITGAQLHDRRLPAIVAGALMKTGLPAKSLILEVTEESLIERDSTTERVISELSRLGVRIAIDDFGVRYSSLNHLRRLLVTQIKLDRAFISGLPGDALSDVIVAAVIEIARRLKCQVIAEGIETREQFDRLQAMGCDAGQGCYFGAPLSAVEIRPFLLEHAKADTSAGSGHATPAGAGR